MFAIYHRLGMFVDEQIWHPTVLSASVQAIDALFRHSGGYASVVDHNAYFG